MPLSPRAKSRLMALCLIILGLSLSVGLALYGLSSRITYFYSPTEIVTEVKAKAKTGAKTGAQNNITTHDIRLGGMVADNSYTTQGINHHFTVTDYVTDITVHYQGILPALFREGQGIVATGRYDPSTNIFNATTILARHDENYMPPDVKRILEANTPQ